MSDHEFQNYLTLLAGLLRLGEKQRRAIAEELRTHLEERLEELVARGVPRDEAIQRALAEFGDAAGLAAQFASITRGKRRRWLMRAVSFSVAATVLIAAGLAIFWPGRHAGPGVAEVVAQAPQQKTAREKPATGKVEPGVEPQRTLDEVLNKRMSLEFTEVPLKEIAAQLTAQTGVTFYIQGRALAEAGINLDVPVTIQLRNVRLSTGLDVLLSELDLTYREQADELIVITTPEDAEASLENRVYDCRDLLAMEAPPGSDQFVPQPKRGGIGGMGGMFTVQDEPKAGGGSADGGAARAAQPRIVEGEPGMLTIHDLRAQRLIDLITSNVAPQSWDSVGGPGSISEFNGLVVVAQTAHVHREVEHVLDMLRKAGGLEVDKQGKAKVVR